MLKQQADSVWFLGLTGTPERPTTYVWRAPFPIWVRRLAWQDTACPVAIMAYRITHTSPAHESRSPEAQTHLSSPTARDFPKHASYLVKTHLATIPMKEPLWTSVQGVLPTWNTLLTPPSLLANYSLFLKARHEWCLTSIMLLNKKHSTVLVSWLFGRVCSLFYQMKITEGKDDLS